MIKQYFGTDGIRGRVGSPSVNKDFFNQLGQSVAFSLRAQKTPVIYIGCDTRESSNELVDAFAQGAIAMGADVVLLGYLPTPAVAYLVCADKASMGVVVSASHNPYTDNGIKFFSADGFKLTDEQELAIEQSLEKKLPEAESQGVITTIDDGVDRYGQFCVQASKLTSLSGLSVVIDAANGAAYEVAPVVFKALGATVTVIAAEPDGQNINEHCGAVHPEALQQKVIECQADLGVAFDGDGDRLIMVDHKGRVVDGDQILYGLVMSRLPDIHTRGVVGTLMTNFGFEQAMKELDVNFVRAKVGDRYVLEQLRERGWFLGGEASGHLIDLKHATTGDALLAVLQVCELLTRQKSTLAELVAGMSQCPQVLINVPITPSFDLASPSLQNEIKQAQASLANSGRVLIRKSGTEPLVRVMVEGLEANQVTKLAEQLADVIKNM